MPRSTVLVVYLLALMAVAAGVIMIAFPRDTSWLMAALVPIAMLGVFVVTLSMPQEPPAPKRRPPPVVVAPGQKGLDTSNATAETGAGSQAERQFPGGVWSGTLRLRSADGRGDLSLVPIRMALEPISAGCHGQLACPCTGGQAASGAQNQTYWDRLLTTEPIRASLLPCQGSGRSERVVAVDVAEYDSQRSIVYLRIAVERQGRARCQEFTTKLVLQDRTLLPEDDTEPATLELNRTSPPISNAAVRCQFPH